ncbi:ATP-binding cassette domain-containing protein [Streptomyces thinghirensis]|nr:ATP-binding cassette domain-containing protein [Streptomyces thinghirensis]
MTKRYGEKVAVNNLSFTVRPGIITGFLGPNGAGKSTTMRMVLGLYGPTAGDVRIDEQHYDQLKDPLTYIGALLEAKAWQGAQRLQPPAVPRAGTTASRRTGCARCWTRSGSRRSPGRRRRVSPSA